MKEEMTHAKRVDAALRGGDVDRPPVSMWRHFFAEETSAEGLAGATLAFQRRFEWDFVKVNPRASYHVEDWGLRTRYDGPGPPRTVETPVRRPEDWLKLRVLDPNRGALGEHLRALEIIASGLEDEIPYLMTVFTPLSIASRLAPSEEVFLEHLREHTDMVEQALDVVTETFIRFSKACLERGASGLFYATTSWASRQRMTDEEYQRFGRPYDLRLLNAIPAAEFHVLHVCRDHNMLDALRDYPVHAFNWDTRGKGNLSLAEGKVALAPRAVIGGLDHGSGLVEATPEEVASQVRELRLAMGGTGWMLGTGCTFPPDTPQSNIDAVRRAATAAL